MNIIYVLKSVKDGDLYIGCTSDLKKRLAAHSNGEVISTKDRRPFKLIYTEDCTDKYDAFNKEKYYKTAKGKKEIKEKISHCGIV